MDKKEYLKIINQFKDLNIAVIGDYMLDKYIWGNCTRISPEAPVPIVKVKSTEYRLGGAGNVVANLASLGSSVSVFGIIGNDTNGDMLDNLLYKQNVHSQLIRSKNNRITTVKTRIIADNQQVTRIDEEKVDTISSKNINKLSRLLSQQSDNFDAVIISDYGKGVVSKELSQIIIDNFNHKLIIVDPKGVNYKKYSGSTAIKPNFYEFKQANKNPELELTAENLEKYAHIMRNNLALKGMVVTLGDKGVFIQNPKNKYKIIPTRAKDVFDVSGAGDTFTAIFTMALAICNDWFIAGDIANYGSGIAVGKVGTSNIDKEELIQYILNIN